MVIFINGSFGVGKTTVSRLLARQLPGSVVVDPEPIGVILMRLAGLWPRRRIDDFQDLASWRAISSRTIGFAQRFRATVIVPMTFSNLDYLGEFLSYLRNRGVPTHHFCLTAPYATVLERLHAREKSRPTAWVLRRSAECCEAHQAPEFARHISTNDRSAREVANEIAACLKTTLRPE